VTVALAAAMFTLAATKISLIAAKVSLAAAKVFLITARVAGKFLGLYPEGIDSSRTGSSHIH